ncbi:ribbon-helix-helix protein, CopG family [candidate division WOR-3 bacterium]|nr:ribbon-helix-helix protein, CopG family [candidate division WOR-3 bacterium]
MTSVRLPKKLESEIEEFARKTGVTKTHIFKEALSAYLAETRGCYIALERLYDKKAKYYTLEEVEKDLGL